MAPRPTRGKQLPPIVLHSLLAREEGLPAPLVYYPNRYGAFFAFAGA